MKSKFFIVALEVVVLYMIMMAAIYYLPEVIDKVKITILIGATYLVCSMLSWIKKGIENNINKGTKHG